MLYVKIDLFRNFEWDLLLVDSRSCLGKEMYIIHNG